MSMLQDFFSFLADLFQEGSEELDYETVKARLVEGGYEDVTAYDVKEAVGLMYEEGSVFNSQQASVLDAYTGGNYVDQSFNAGDIGVAVSTGQAGPALAAPQASGGGHEHQPPPYQPPPPPPMDPGDGYTDLDAAVEQILYVNNVTNNTTNITTVNDNDTFEDNDTVVDSSVNQTILAAGDVNQDFDTTIAGEGGIAVAGEASGANLVTGDNEGVIAGDIENSAVVAGDNEGIAAGNSQVEGNAIGDNNTVLNDSDGNAVGDGATAVNIAGTNAGPVAVGGDAIQAAAGGAVSTGEGDAFVAANSQVATGGGDNIANQGGNVNTGEGDLNDIDAYDSVVETGEGDVEAINDSFVGAAGFGGGDAANTTLIGNEIDDSVLNVGDHNAGEADSSVELAIDASVDHVQIDESALVGSDVTADGDIGGDLGSEADLLAVDVPEPDHEPADA